MSVLGAHIAAERFAWALVAGFDLLEADGNPLNEGQKVALVGLAFKALDGLEEELRRMLPVEQELEALREALGAAD